METTLADSPALHYLPEILDLTNAQDLHRYQELVSTNRKLSVCDFYKLQKKELLKTRNPSQPLSAEQLDALYMQQLNERNELHEGVWVYYDWLQKIVHTLCEEEFIELRTNRNFYKITPAEQKALATKTLGIIGLSVGNAVGICIATERICGKIKLADFDTIELSNLNRISTSIANIGINKSIVTARAIAEIDPFIKVVCYTDGIHENNLSSFLLEDGQLDILIDECDSVDIKLMCREAARSHGIPVVMETSDRGMLDVERFDLEKQREIFHGLLGNFPVANLKNIPNEQRLGLVMRLTDAPRGSVRGKASLLELGRSISTWPQLASSVTLGGAVVTDVCRRILLDQFHQSGRFYIDIEAIAGDPKPAAAQVQNPFAPFSVENALKLVADFTPMQNAVQPSVPALKDMIAYANMAPSMANNQPWQWIYNNRRLFLFRNNQRSFSFIDFDGIASDISFGAAYENLRLRATETGYHLHADLYPLPNHPSLIASISFLPAAQSHFNDSAFNQLVSNIPERVTNRNPSTAVPIPANDLALLKSAAEETNGVTLHCFFSKEEIITLGKIIGECERIKTLHAQGHQELIHQEIRWTPEQAEKTRDGIDIRTMALAPPLMAALGILQDPEVAALLKKVKGARALVDAAIGNVLSASMMGIITVAGSERKDLLAGGMAMQRLWLQATALGYSIHPLATPLYLFPRVLKANGEGLDSEEVTIIEQQWKAFNQLLKMDDEDSGVFIFKLAKAGTPHIKSMRLPVEDTLFLANMQI